MYPENKIVSTIVKPQAELKFKPIALEDIEIIRPYLENSHTRSCDYTIGGLLIWKDLFRYEYSIYDDTLFIKSLSEDGSGRTAFLRPIGRLPLEESIEILRCYCSDNNIDLLFTAIPEEYLDDFVMRSPFHINELYDMADYIYDANSLATLTGKAYNKKRNHVNRFLTDNPNYSLEEITDSNIDEVKAFLANLGIESEKADEDMAYFEMNCCAETLENFNEYGFEGALLRDNEGKIVAFTFGEVSGDTLILHIEKMEHLVPGAGETINKLFAERMLLLNPELKYINREDDAGDPGLRRAKESYHPAFMLKKYNIEF